MEKKEIDEKDIRNCYRFLAHDKETEIRLIDPKKEKMPMSIFTHSEDEFIEVCKKYNGIYNLYAGINERRPNGTTKNDVISVKTIVIDIDAPRPNPKEPATNEELKKAEEVCNNILKTIECTKQKIPVQLCSGNGYQIWFAIPEFTIDDINRQEIEDKLQLFQDKVKEKFDIYDSIDKIGDLPRIIKIWGTLNIKGNETEERPYRIAHVVGWHERIENPYLKEQILELEPQKIPEYSADEINELELDKLPPCINHLLKFYVNSNGNYWYRIIQFLASFFRTLGLDKEKSKSLIIAWNKRQPYHEDGEEKDIIQTIERIYRNGISIANCEKIKTEKGGFPYFGLADLKLCKADNKCNKCINPIIRYKRAAKDIIKTEEGIIDSSLIKLDSFVENVERFYKKQAFFFDKSGLFWFWDNEKFKWEKKDEVDILNAIDEELKFWGQTIKSEIKNNYIEAFKRVGRKNIPKEPKNTWIQFKDIIFDIKTKNKMKATKEYFFCNPIPYEIGESSETPVMEKLFSDWNGNKDTKDLYEILAYCCLTDYPIHLAFVFIGHGRNGKSSFLKIIRNFLGSENICSTELDYLAKSRFESSKLYKKLVAIMGETNFGMIDNTAMFKKLTGQDLIGGEFKHKGQFDFINYAKLIISTNSLPTSYDTSEGFYRRWYIKEFRKEFPEGKDIIETIPKGEYNALAKKITEILPNLIEKGLITNQGTIQERKIKYVLASNPLAIFLNRCCIKDISSFTSYAELYSAYRQFLLLWKKRIVNRKEFKETLENEGFFMERTSKKINDDFISNWWINGLCLKEGWRKACDDYVIMYDSLTSPMEVGISEENSVSVHNLHKDLNKIDVKEEQIGEN